MPEVLRVKGVLALSDHTAAERFFVQSMELARRQGALSWELRTAMDLAKLWASRGQVSEAIDVLSRAHARFTEGYQTADLVSARRLIDELTAVAR
jgi:predicted ATPase